MFKRKKQPSPFYRSHQQAVRLGTRRRQRRRSRSFATTALTIIFASILAVWVARQYLPDPQAASTSQTDEQTQPSAEVFEEVITLTPSTERHTTAPIPPVPDRNKPDQPAEEAQQSRLNAAKEASSHQQEIARMDKPMTRKAVRTLITPFVEQEVYPPIIHHPKLAEQSVEIQYTLDPELQAWAEKRLRRYRPDYGVYVALNPDNGKILALASHHSGDSLLGNLATRATYPAASVIKLITAAAALQEGKATPNKVYTFNGKSTSLYKKQVFEPQQNKWTRRMSLETAFAKSVNPIFGRIGSVELGGPTLLKYAEKFGFNARFITDFNFDNGSIELDVNDRWQTAESASGYTRRNTLSPIHGATLAAAIINGGDMIAPVLVESIVNKTTKEQLYQAGAPRRTNVLSTETTQHLQRLMNATVKSGTGRRSFKRFFQGDFEDLVVGGKTGHLSGTNPKGSYDWFIGYGSKDNKKLAFAMLCINTDKWYVRSSQFAREAIEQYFKREEISQSEKPKTTS